MTPREQAEDYGYRVHKGTPEDGELAGRYWWTLYRDGWSGCESSGGDWATDEDAWGDAIVAHANELMEP